MIDNKGFHLLKVTMNKKPDWLELIHSNVSRPINIYSLGGASYIVIFIDDASRKVWAYL